MTALTGIAFCFFVAWQAYNKGYNPVFWFLAAGPIGYFILLFLPDLKKSQLPVEEIIKKRKVGNGIALVFTMVMVVLIILLTAGSSHG